MAPFCSCPASLVSRKFFAVGPGCAKCFVFCCAPLGAATFRRGQSKKKNTTQGVFFFAPAPGKGKGRRSPVGRRHGARAKKKTPPRVLFFFLRPRRKAREGEAPLGAGTGPEQKKTPPRVFFFCSGPGERQGKEKPRWAPARGQSKKCFFFFALAPCRRPTGLLLPLPFPGAGAKKKHPGWCFFFCSGPVSAPNGASPSLAFRRGRSKKKKKTPSVVFFFFALAPCRRPTGLLLPLPFAGAAAKKKNTLGGVFVFAAAPHSLTAGLGGDASPSPGWCFFLLRPRPDRGGVFFFAVAPPGRSLTHGGLGRFRQGPGGVFFFLLRPRRVWGTTSGLKRPGGATAKKKTPLPVL